MHSDQLLHMYVFLVVPIKVQHVDVVNFIAIHYRFIATRST